MPQQTVFDLDGRQEIEKLNCELEDEISTLKKRVKELEPLEETVSDLEKEVEKLKDKWKDAQQELDRLTRYDLCGGGCDESTCNASMKPHKRGDYLPYDEVERIMEF